MRKRLTRTEDGRTVQTALVYTLEDHGVDPHNLDPDAVKAVRRLQRHGFEAYIVGGAVRDLLLGKQPKDFDVATSATPTQIKKLFRNSRIIGKRFRLVHLLYRDKVIEVSTFRSHDSQGFRNVYGTLEEDVRRRDFSANALFLNPQDNSIIDFVSGVKNIESRTLQPVIPLGEIFREDPVRILRALKYATAGQFRIPWRVRRRMKRESQLLADIPASRMTEELFKILNSGVAGPIIESLLDMQAFQFLVPRAASLAQRNRMYRRKLLDRLRSLDEIYRESGPQERVILLVHLCADYLLEFGPFQDQQRIPYNDAWRAVKEFLQPITPANKEVERGLKEIFRNKGRLLREEPPEDGERPGRRHRRRRRRHGSPVPERTGNTPAG